MDICRSNLNLVASDIVRGIFSMFLLRALQEKPLLIAEKSSCTLYLSMQSELIGWNSGFVIFNKKIQIHNEVTDD